MTTKTEICTIVGVVGAAIAQLFGGWDTALQTLLVFMLIDFVMGIIVSAVFHKSKKNETGALSSAVLWRGVCKKVCTLLIIVCANYADKLLVTDYVRDTVVIGFCAAEFLSIIELAGLMGILPKPVQQLLEKVIDILNRKGGGSDGN